LLAKQIDSANAQELDRQLLAVSNEMSKLNPDRNAVAAAASAAAPFGTADCRAIGSHAIRSSRYAANASAHCPMMQKISALAG